ncbi:MAG: glycosyltransferase family 2 protein [Planctomycetes bacterium]|nr:glycosyltransferase family 2 protein [Planctomycetota bacterium]MCB9891139.1 glycosyltransferase family 2 protein [Planctomycetota bacterium]MCB9918906.1 glycosyltransferase family 2 protein [Planctomycetota bacterium]
MSDVSVSIFVPTWNGGDEFRTNLGLLLAQKLDRPFEIVVIDSGSTDGTREFLETQPVRLVTIANREFNHGLTRNRGIELCKGDIVALTVQDARPESTDWLQRLVDCFDDPRVVGAFGRQVARADANPFIRHRLSGWVAAGTEPRIQEISNPEEFWKLAPLERLQRIAFDNVNSAVRRSTMQEIPFRERKFGEDIDWSMRAILAGHRIVFEPRSAVVHSHDNSAWYEFKRTYADHSNLHETLGVHTIKSKKALLRCIRYQARVYREVIDKDERIAGFWRKLSWRFRSWTFSIAENSGQYFGAKSARKLREGSRFYRRLDRLLRRGV